MRRVSHETPDPTNADCPIVERTSVKLAKQLRRFQGCTHEEHAEADGKHQVHHQRPDVHSKCSSISDITSLIRGSHVGGTPLPDVLSSSRLMKASDAQGVDCQAAFEGTSARAAPEDVETRNQGLPRNLCLSQHHADSRKRRQPRVTFDIDSTSCFPTSLAFASRGIDWFPRASPMLNLSADIHFGLKVHSYTAKGNPSETFAPLHKVPHYCFGSVIGMSELLVFVFFPTLHEESSYEHSTYLSQHDHQLWLDAILLPSIIKVVGSSNILQHYPASSRVASLDASAASAEGLARKDSAREQLLKHAIQPQYLDALWTLVLETIEENPGFHRFRGATLFAHAKNTKLEFSRPGLTDAYDIWKQRWSEATNSEFYNKDRTYVDIAKQITSEDSALPYDQISDEHEAETYLWKRCCLEAYAKTREVLNPDGSKAKGNPKRTVYPWATMRDTMGQTFFTAPQGVEARDGLIYSQFYELIKTPFDSTKVYVFDNDSVENLALDPGYVRSLQQEGGAITFSKGVCEFAYLHSKKRAHANLLDNRWRSYGTREEHRISLTMMEEIYEQWRQWDLYDADDIDDGSSPLPYYIVPTCDLLSFLYAQINKYCFLFEYIRAHTAKTYSLPETVIMVIALRALRFCYGSSILERETLLFRDCWQQIHGQKVLIKEGLGMKKSIERCGIGWFLPKFNWALWRLAAPHGENVLVGNMLMHEEYKRRWRAVKDLRDVFVRFNQAKSWYDQYNMQGNRRLRTAWLEYLHVLNLEQFDADVWKAMLKANKRSPELNPECSKLPAETRFCYSDMKRMFLVNGTVGPPHLVTGNKMRFEGIKDLLNFLFLWDERERSGWGNKPYRVILQKTFELVEQHLGYRQAEKWLSRFLHLVRLTHWILPYPSPSGLITSTKTSQNRGLKRRMMWFSVVYADPTRVKLPLERSPSTLCTIIWRARRQTFGESNDAHAWSTGQLLTGVEAQGVQTSGHERFWVAGKKSIGLKGFMPLWERGRPPQLKMLGQLHKKSLEELQELMAELSVEHAGDDSGDDISDDADEEAKVIRRDAAIVAGRNITAALARTAGEGMSGGSERQGTLSIVESGSGSIFSPSRSG